jgi:hypothetical protein
VVRQVDDRRTLTSASSTSPKDIHNRQHKRLRVSLDVGASQRFKHNTISPLYSELEGAETTLPSHRATGQVEEGRKYQVVSPRMIFITDGRTVTIPVNKSFKPGHGRVVPLDVEVDQSTFVRFPSQSGPIVQDTCRPHSRHPMLTTRINLVPGKHSRTGEILNSNLDGTHD